VLTPYLQMIRGNSPAVFLHGKEEPSTTMFWLTAKHNWNAVCFAGVTGAALTQIESRQTRAEFSPDAMSRIARLFMGAKDRPRGFKSEPAAPLWLTQG